MPAVLHVGMPKCGSSALQTVLSHRPVVAQGDGAPACYVAILEEGRVLHGQPLVDFARSIPCAYAISARASDLVTLGPDRLLETRGELAAVARRSARLLLSNEGWAHDHEAFAQHRLLERLGLRCDVVAYVRPQVEWCNSGWWQWGAWTEANLRRWVNEQLDVFRWARLIERWRVVPGVERVRVRLLPRDIVSDFFALLGLDSPGEPVAANVSLPAPLLRIFQRHREFRSGPHDSDIEFALGRHLRTVANLRAPWVLRQGLVKEILDATREDNLALLAMLDETQREQMRGNPAWWSADHYAERPVETWQPCAPAPGELEEVAVAMIRALGELDARVRRAEEALRLQHRETRQPDEPPSAEDPDRADPEPSGFGFLRFGSDR